MRPIFTEEGYTFVYIKVRRAGHGRESRTGHSPRLGRVPEMEGYLSHFLVGSLVAASGRCVFSRDCHLSPCSPALLLHLLRSCRVGLAASDKPRLLRSSCA